MISFRGRTGKRRSCAVKPVSAATLLAVLALNSVVASLIPQRIQGLLQEPLRGNTGALQGYGEWIAQSYAEKQYKDQRVVRIGFVEGGAKIVEELEVSSLPDRMMKNAEGPNRRKSTIFGKSGQITLTCE